MPSEEISAQQAQGFGGDLEAQFQAYKYKPIQADYDEIARRAKLVNTLPGETAPKYWKNVDPQYQSQHLVDDPYTTPGYGISSGFGPNAPNTVYGNPNGRFVADNGPGGKGGQNVGGIMQLGGSKSQGPQFSGMDHLKYDPKQAVWDDNYGWIIPKPQPKGNKDDWVTGALMTGASLAAGAVGIPPLAMGAIQAAKGYGSGESLGKIGMNILPSLIGSGLGQSGFNLPPGLSQIYNYGRQAYGAYNTYNSMKNGNYMAGLGTVLPFASQFMRG